jgi:dihydroorotase
MQAPLLLSGARLVDPELGLDRITTLGIADGRIVAPDALPRDTACIDLSGLVIVPGLIDLHVHLRDPGQTRKEDLSTGTAAAAAGGFTTVVAMPNTSPPIDRPERVRELLERAEHEAVVRVLPTAALTRDRGGMEPTSDASALARAGAAALTDDGSTPPSAAVLRDCMRRAAAAGLAVLDHCEDASLAALGPVHDGHAARVLRVTGNPHSTELVAVARDLALAAETECRVHIQHVSCAGTLDLIREARHRGVRVTAEVTPHHLLLTERAVIEHGANARMNPPLRTEADRLALLAGVMDGTIEVIATDHAPHATSDKEGSLTTAAPGIIGLETAVVICLTLLVADGGMPLSHLVSRFTTGPARVLGLPPPSLAPGAPADLTVLDLGMKGRVDVTTMRSKSRNCPYHGFAFRGGPAATMVAGAWVWKNADLARRCDG